MVLELHTSQLLGQIKIQDVPDKLYPVKQELQTLDEVQLEQPAVHEEQPLFAFK
jgi:hypothetical protein